MRQMIEFFKGLFDSDLWPPRWHCGYWTDFHGWLYIISDLAIWSAYFAIPIVIIKYIRTKTALRFQKIYFLFAVFILSCGLTHLFDAVTFWVPMYRLNALIRLITGIVSWLTIYHLIKILPTAFTLKTNDQLEAEITKNKVLVNELEDSNVSLKKQSNFIENILDSTIDFINVFDTQLNLLSVNKRTEELLNKTKADLIGKNFNELFPGAVGNEYHQQLIRSMSGLKVNQKVFIAPTGRFYETDFVILNENNIQYAVLVISRDITDNLEKEEKLIRLNEELNTQINKLNNANAELEQFAYILSHDLQSPLRKIQTFSSIVIESKEMDTNKIYLEKIGKSAKRMKDLIEDVLEFSKVSNQNEAFKIIDLNEIIDGVKNDLELMVINKKASIIFDALPKIVGVKHQISQVFTNLIGNSLKYCINEPVVTLTHSFITKASTEHPMKYVEIKIQDNGIGFDQKYSEDIFTPFKRLNNSLDYEGTGIGLALVKKIIEVHKGTIKAESTSGIGTLFTIYLPLDPNFEQLSD